jgi:glutathione-regulated potassium-efflux system ancillary protein KefC
MENVWFVAAIWVGLALVATLLAIWLKLSTLAIWLKLSTALSEIVVGTVAQLVIGTFVGAEALAGRSDWVTFPQAQYSYLVATVICSAVVPTMIANAFFMPTRLLPSGTRAEEAVVSGSR